MSTKNQYMSTPKALNMTQFEKEFLDFEKFTDYMRVKLKLDVLDMDKFYQSITSTPEVQDRILKCMLELGTMASQAELGQNFSHILIDAILDIAVKNEYPEIENLKHVMNTIIPALLNSQML